MTEVCRCNSQEQNPDCHIDHTHSILELNLAFPQRGQESNPNPMNSRCGLEDCDCEYTIGGLLRRLEIIAEYANKGLIATGGERGTLLAIKLMARQTVNQTRDACDSSCLCYVAGSEEERQPPGA